MRHIFIVLLMFMSVSVQAADWPENWTATDSKGQSYTLHDMLGAGKAVVIHFTYSG